MYLITDQQPGEPAILTNALRFAYVTIKTLEGAEVLKIAPPFKGWDHQRLEQVMAETRLLMPDQFEQGVDAYLENQFIGSTEC